MQQLPEFLREPPRFAGNGTAERQGQARREPDLGGNGGAPRSFAVAGGPANVAGGPAANGEARRKLHLSLSHGNDGPQDQDPASRPSQNTNTAPAEDRPERRIGGAPPPRAQSAYVPASPPGPSQYPRSANGPPAHMPAEIERPGEGATFIGRSLRERVDGDIAAFLAAFDAALDHDTQESRTELREATDRLLRAGARTRIELERLEARVPLSPRDRGGPGPIMRQR